MPRRFQFRLQPVLDQRERIEEREQLRVAEFERQRLGIEDVLRQVQSELVKAREELRDRLRVRSGSPGEATIESPGLAGVRTQANAMLHMTLKAQRAAIELAGAMSRLEAARTRLVAASTDRKAVQMLKDKRLAEHRADMLRREAAELDELAVMRHGRDNAATPDGDQQP